MYESKELVILSSTDMDIRGARCDSNKIQETLPVSKFFIWCHLKILDHYNFVIKI